jgi:type I restriction enzyme S subunit
MYGATIGRLGWLSVSACTNQACCALAVPQGVSPRFAFFALLAANEALILLASGGGQPNINQEKIRAFRLPLPSLAEQEAIAAFLDQETGKIDALVAEQERLIALLKEKRQAVISQAVTKGLNPNAPMKDSGIEWLGQVPAHWEVKRIKNLSTTISKGTTPTTIGADFVTTGVRFLKAENINDGNVQSFPEFFISGEAHQTLSRSSLQVNDVLVVIAGATTGKSAVLNADLLPANTNQAVSFIRCRDTANAKLIHLWLTTDAVQNLIRLGSVQSAQPNLSMEDLGNLPILTVPQFEKSAILDYLEIKSTEYQTLILEAEKAISLLRERRAALISAAVTGKIDVRALATSQPEAA